MTKRTLRAGAAPFAHLLGFAAKKAEDGDQDDGRKARRAEEDQRRKDEDARRAEEDGVDVADPPEDDEGVDGDPKPDVEDIEDPDDSVDEDAAPDESDTDPKVRKAAKAGRKAERGRWAKVLGHKAATGRVPAACQLLASSPMGASAIIATLASLPAAEAPRAGHPNLQDRMGSRQNPRVGSDVSGGGEQTFGQQVAAAVSKVRGK
jgi:hypothetical protein